MLEKFKIAAYTRISVDLELDRDNTSIENQKAIIGEYCKIHFPSSSVDYFEDRDRSGYSFNQRPDYNRLRPMLMDGKYDILIVKDLSRFSRRTGRGLAEFEDLAEKNIRIIAIGDGVDYDQDHIDDWMKIKLYFFVNEMPVTDASRKVSEVITNRQARGEWICAVPYGYFIKDSKKMTFEVDEPSAEVIREIFRLYVSGWGYRKIANHLTDLHVPTPRMCERARKEANGDECKRKTREQWSIATISTIVHNDFYIGTLREHKFHRKAINGVDIELKCDEHIVFENHHKPIVDYRLYATAQEQLKQRTSNSYRGVKKYENIYSGLIFCGDCGSPMFVMGHKNSMPAYTCGTYHLRGRLGCSSHHTRTDFLDTIIKQYVKKVRDNSVAMIDILEEMLSHERQTTDGVAQASEELKKQITIERDELMVLMRQRARDAARNKGSSDAIEKAYDSLIEGSNNRILGLENQLANIVDATNAIIRINRVSKTIIETFDSILEKSKLDKQDLYLIIDRILVYEDRVEIKLKNDIDEILRTGTVEHLENEARPSNFELDTENIKGAKKRVSLVAAESVRNTQDEVFCVNVVNKGRPLLTTLTDITGFYTALMNVASRLGLSRGAN